MKIRSLVSKLTSNNFQKKFASNIFLKKLFEGRKWTERRRTRFISRPPPSASVWRISPWPKQPFRLLVVPISNCKNDHRNQHTRIHWRINCHQIFTIHRISIKLKFEYFSDSHVPSPPKSPQLAKTIPLKWFQSERDAKRSTCWSQRVANDRNERRSQRSGRPALH